MIVIKGKCEGPSQATHMEKVSSGQGDVQLVYTTVCSEQKPMIRRTKIKKATYFYDEMTIVNNCTFSEHWL